MVKRGVLYVVWGEYDGGALERSRQSLARVHPDMPVEVIELPAGSTLLDKARMMELSPFEETLFLDADTVVLDDLSYGFEQVRRFGLACSICECPWARRYTGLSGDMVEYNTGVLLFYRIRKAGFQCLASLRSGDWFFNPISQRARIDPDAIELSSRICQSVRRHRL